MIGQAPGSRLTATTMVLIARVSRYKEKRGNVDLYASYLFSDDYNANNGLNCKRKAAVL